VVSVSLKLNKIKEPSVQVVLKGNADMKSLEFQLTPKTQRTCHFHERTGKEPPIYPVKGLVADF
jgi:hypothetical protein